ncbi:MAG: hypothetical protein CM15mV116_210 [uncultured marine virus]|nr:MAG: hypothetical protein CM15mV116_210 [uncultured marine virus]
MKHSTLLDSKEHQAKKFNIIANESLVLNSGFVPEAMNDTFKTIIKPICLDSKKW